jgi:DNA-binding NarL/FixJ family response regulator
VIRIVIVDDHQIVRAGLRQFFSEQVDLRVTGEAATGREVLELIRGGEVDVIVMDISMPDQSGIEVLAAIKARAPELPVLILSGFPESHYATMLLKQGASGYLNKECDPDEIIKAIRALALGRKYITPAVAELLANGLNVENKSPHETLSERETQVFLRLSKGETIGNIAEGMSLSVKTVSTYRTRVMEKLHLASNSDLTYYALKNGLIQ